MHLNSRVIVFLSLCVSINPVSAQQAGSSWEADPAQVAKDSARNPQFNYEESKVPTFTLPDPLKMADGRSVSSKQDWINGRRDELVEVFRREVYGRRPTTEYHVDFQVLAETDDVFEGKATGRDMQAIVTIGEREFKFPFTVFIPNAVTEPGPVIVFINNRRPDTVQSVIEEEASTGAKRTIIDRGYAIATFHTSDVDPDRKDGYADGIRAFFANGQPLQNDDWGGLSAWGWAASRVLDYMVAQPEIDSSRTAVGGHSRSGKTALWAAAEDPRFSIAYSNDSGCGGAAISRRRFGETVGRITSVFPHWFCENFTAYSEREDQLPVDQHELLALIAPRAVYVASADLDLWADPKGEYASVVAAAPVYQLLGEEVITDPEMPPLNTPRHIGKTGYHIRSGAHMISETDWKMFLDFAAGQWSR
ncbi:alpha/beta hydrolase family protein [Aporhodopirellula aestuarii]|uniref:Acetylxylan esterase n=1 Tax=Aporhodopirellula aestuarii TaxID=2950107 RepID=A0ABT0UCL3_9BACT|nr:acetylxylan esterase [Aporhodopirellula aestuarii]MCM2374510.1 acetylxylan esterase [Aporhodopirellula aestuarii]